MATHSSVLPGESQGRGSLMGCRLWGRTESDTTEVTQQQQQQLSQAEERKGQGSHSQSVCGVPAVAKAFWKLLQYEAVHALPQGSQTRVVDPSAEPTCTGFQEIVGRDQHLLTAWWQLQPPESGPWQPPVLYLWHPHCLGSDQVAIISLSEIANFSCRQPCLWHCHWLWCIYLWGHSPQQWLIAPMTLMKTGSSSTQCQFPAAMIS